MATAITKRTSLKKKLHDVPYHVVLIALLVITFYPLVFMVFTSFKNNPQFFHTFWLPTVPLHAENYGDSWTALRGSVWNTIVIALISVAGVVVFSALTAFAFARHSFLFKNVLFMAILALLMIPQILTLIPQFVLVKNLGLLNSNAGLILPYIAGGQAFSIFVLRSFFASIPEEIFEAARLDGANEFQVFTRIAVPLSYPILGTVAIFQVLNVWNDYVWPLVVLSDPAKWTISLSLVAFSNQNLVNQQFGPMFAGYVISAIPLVILFAFTMKLFIRGLASGAIKA